MHLETKAPHKVKIKYRFKTEKKEAECRNNIPEWTLTVKKDA